MNKVLILYGTRFGTTKGISDEIEKVVKDNGITTESYNLTEVNHKNIPPLDQYDGIIIGTGIKMGMWTKVVKNFFKKRKEELKQKQNSGVIVLEECEKKSLIWLDVTNEKRFR